MLAFDEHHNEESLVKTLESNIGKKKKVLECLHDLI